MLCFAAIICIINTFYSLAVNAYGLAWVGYRAGKTVPASLMEALTAGIITITGMFTTYHNIAFTAAVILIIGTVTYSTG